MSNDSVTEVTTQGWLSRIKSALAAMIIGPLFIIGAVVLLWWNEGRAIRTAEGLREGKKEVVSIPIDSIQHANEGHLVHLTGKATTEETLRDEDFGVEQNALKLRRQSEMYQWIEKKESTSEKKMGGSETTTTRYTYTKEWSSKLVDSSQFKELQGHTNPNKFSHPSETWIASNATIGAFQLSENLIQKIDQETKIAMESSEDEDGPTVDNGDYYIGEDSKNPAIGDERISYYATLPGEISVVAEQTGGSLNPFTTKNGTTIALVQSGTHSAEELFTAAEQENAILTWLLRFAGWLLSMIGFSMIMGPLSVIADVIPFLGTVVGFGTGFVSLILGTIVAVVIIAIAWFAYRPILAVGMLVLLGAVIYFLIRRKKKFSQ